MTKVGKTQIPSASIAIIGGSGTFSISFPESLNVSGLQVLSSGMVFPTPYGDSPPLKLFTLKRRKVLTVRMHGWRDGVSRADASRQLFWVLRQAGVKRIIAEGGVGSVNHLLRPRDIVIPSDYIDFSMRRDTSLEGGYLLSMRKAVCPVIREALFKTAEEHSMGRVFERGVYAVTDGRHFESPAEVRMLGQLGADIVGQSMVPEIYLAREIAACYARMDVVVNYGEGVVKDWEHVELSDIFHREAKRIGTVLIDTLKRLGIAQSCGCPKFRYETLLKE